jgi:uncharacterized membrane protein
MKRHFITGLIILLPLALTIVVVAFFFNLLTAPFLGISEAIFDYFGIFDEGIWIFSSSQVRLYASKLIIVLVLFSFTVALGAVARWFLFRSLLRLWDFILHRIPFVSSIYKTFQDVVSTLFASKANSFQDVVLVPFPNRQSQSIGLVTRTGIPAVKKDQVGTLTAVFVPTTPNPTSGFLIMFSDEDIIYLDMKVEEAFKYVVSCGVLSTPIIAAAKQKLVLAQLEPEA